MLPLSSPANVPTVQITSIGGLSVPQPPSGSTATPDVTIPSSTANPLTINISTVNVPNGAVIKLRIVHQNGTIIETTSTSVSSNAATASATLPPGTGVVYATVTFP